MRRFALLLLVFSLYPALAAMQCGATPCGAFMDACCGNICYNTQAHGCCGGLMLYALNWEQCCAENVVCPAVLVPLDIPVTCEQCLEYGIMIGEISPLVAEKQEIKDTVMGYVRKFFGFWEFFRIEGAKDLTSGFFNAEFLAAFFLIYFLAGSATGFRGIGGGIPKFMMVLIFTAIMWNMLGGFRWERFVIFIIPPVLVYYILYDSLTKFVMVQKRTVKLIALTAAAISFLFISPNFITFVNGHFSFGILDNLQFLGTAFFVIVIAGMIFTKLSMVVMLPMEKPDGVKMREAFRIEVENIKDPDLRRKVKQQLAFRKRLEEVTS